MTGSLSRRVDGIPAPVNARSPRSRAAVSMDLDGQPWRASRGRESGCLPTDPVNARLLTRVKHDVAFAICAETTAAVSRFISGRSRVWDSSLSANGLPPRLTN